MKLLSIEGWQGLLGTLWASPITILVSLFYIIPFLIMRQYRFVRRKGWVQEFIVNDNTFSQKLWKGWSGWSCGNFIVYGSESSSNNEKTQTHERRHSSQIFTFGIIQPISYIVHMIFIYFFQKDKHPYIDCVWERDARREAGQKVEFTKKEWYWGEDDRWPWW